MEDLKSPLLPCPTSTTVRRNPPRRAKASAATFTFSTPTTTTTTTTTHTISASKSKTAVKRKDIPSFPLQEILECEVPRSSTNSNPTNCSENLRVFLRIKPLVTTSNLSNATSKRKGDGLKTKTNLQTKKKSMTKIETETEACLVVNNSQSVTLTPPQSMQDAKRPKSEVYDGFTHVFDSDSSQNQVYEKVMEPLVLDFLNGKSGMVTAMGPTGSGKTHTIFGSPRHPGMLSLALTNIFGGSSSSFYVSMFEIYSEKGKGERLIDLSSDGPDLVLQQANVKGLQEVMVSSVVEAEAVIARGTLKRTTAVTNSNSQSSRSQCIINIRRAPETVDGEVEIFSNNALLTIVDLAGAEREKKTGNQGTRLSESNFINNTSMVFGLCLRSLLEHQKNPKKTLQKHFQNSLLTKYLRDYFEGKKRMALILTVKCGGDDYLDASFLLRQASPYMKIKFNIVEEPCQKRNISKLPREEKPKRRKLSDPDAYIVIDEGKSAKDEDPLLGKELISASLEQLEPLNDSISPSISVQVVTNESALLEEYCVELEGLKRSEHVMLKFSKALWNVLKQYNSKLKESENEVQLLKESLKDKNAQYVRLEKENEELNSCFRNFKQESTEASSFIQLAVDSRSPNFNISLSNLGRDDASTEQCPKWFLQAESSGTVVDYSTLSIEDLKQNDNQSHESPTVNGSGVKLIEDNHAGVNEDLSSADNAERGLQPSDLTVSSTTFHTEEEMVRILVSSKKESGSVDTCSAVEKPSSRRQMASSSILKEMNDLGIEHTRLKALPGSHVLPKEAVDAYIGRKTDSENMSPWTEKKPRRRLLPASSILLREINELKDENERPMVSSRGGKRAGAEGIGRTQGSASLLKLLNNLHL